MTQFSAEYSQPLTVAELLEKRDKAWDLEVVAGSDGLDAIVSTSELNRPALALAGYFDVFSAERIQLIGLTESSYLDAMPPEQRDNVIRRMLAYTIPAIIVTTGRAICEELVRQCGERRIPLLRTPLITSPFLSDLTRFLQW